MAENRTDTAERTEQPTPQRLREARRHGRIPRSAELTGAAAGLAALAGLALLAPGLLDDLTRLVRTFLDASAAPPADGPASLAPLVLSAAWPAVARCGLLLVLAGIAAVAVGAVQSGGTVSAERIRPDLERVGLAAGLRRLLSPRTVVRCGMTLAKLAVVAAAGWWAIRPALGRLAASAGLGPEALAARVGSAAWALAVRVAVAMLALGLIDYAWQYWQHRRDLRMTRREWLRDMRELEPAWRPRGRNRTGGERSGRPDARTVDA